MYCFDDIHSIWNRNKDKFTITFIIESISEWWICHTRFQLCCISLRLYWPSESCFLMVTSLVRRKSQHWPRFSEAALKEVGNESHWSAKTDSKAQRDRMHSYGDILHHGKKVRGDLAFPKCILRCMEIIRPDKIDYAINQPSDIFYLHIPITPFVISHVVLC